MAVSLVCLLYSDSTTSYDTAPSQTSRRQGFTEGCKKTQQLDSANRDDQGFFTADASLMAQNGRKYNT